MKQQYFSVFFFSVLFFSQANLFNDTHTLEAVDPILLDGLSGIYTTDQYFKFQNPYLDTSLLGVYVIKRRLIKFIDNRSLLHNNGMNITQLLCHELMHHHWNTKMTSEQKDYWTKEANGSDADEFHSEYYEKHWQRCFG